MCNSIKSTSKSNPDTSTSDDVFIFDNIPTNTDICDDIFSALQTTFEEKVSKYSLNDVEKEALIMALRSRLQEVYPSAMGSPRISEYITDCIGETKLVRINNTEKEGRVGEVVAKLEVR